MTAAWPPERAERQPDVWTADASVNVPAGTPASDPVTATVESVSGRVIGLLVGLPAADADVGVRVTDGARAPLAPLNADARSGVDRFIIGTGAGEVLKLPQSVEVDGDIHAEAFSDSADPERVVVLLSIERVGEVGGV